MFCDDCLENLTRQTSCLEFSFSDKSFLTLALVTDTWTQPHATVTQLQRHQSRRNCFYFLMVEIKFKITCTFQKLLCLQKQGLMQLHATTCLVSWYLYQNGETCYYGNTLYVGYSEHFFRCRLRPDEKLVTR